MSDPEAAGDAETGAPRTPRPEAAPALPTGAADDGHTHERVCLNCGAPLAGEYCHACGQKAHVHRTLKAFWHDLAHSALHFEGKIWRTLPLLAWKPGELTRRYIEGERARFVSPIALFLFTVFLMFAVFTLAGPSVDAGELRNTGADVRAALEHEKTELGELRQARQQAVRENDVAAVREIDAAISETEVGIRSLNQFLTATDPDSAGLARARTGWVLFDNMLKKLNENPALTSYKVQANAYKFSWALIPISVPFVWLLFLHRRRYRRFGAYDHTVFVTYSISFMTITLVVVALLQRIPGADWVGTAVVAIPPIHIYRQLRGAYGLSPLSAVWRTIALLAFTGLALGLFLMLLLALGVVT